MYYHISFKYQLYDLNKGNFKTFHENKWIKNYLQEEVQKWAHFFEIFWICIIKKNNDSHDSDCLRSLLNTTVKFIFVVIQLFVKENHNV